MSEGKEYSIVAEQKLCMAHRLMGHPGKCNNLHGHNYRVRIRICRSLDCMGKDGMVMDFGEVKEKVLKFLDDTFDHTTVLEQGDPLIHAILESRIHCQLERTSVIPVLFRPTAENLAKCFYDLIKKQLPPYETTGIRLDSVSIEETPGNWACYSE